MLPVDIAITRFRRDLVIAALLRGALVIVALGCILAGPVFGRDNGMFVLMIVGAAWVLLSYRSLQRARLAADSPSLIAAGEFDRAEDHIDTALRTFSLFRTAKLLSLHHLALLRHAQHRWRESALLCQAVLSQNLATLQSLAKTTLLLLADSMLQMGDLKTAFDALTRLFRLRLNLAEALTLQLLQLDYGSRIGAWESMLQGSGIKVQMSELMPTLNAARSQAYLSLAAYKSGRLELAAWLRRRAELLADPKDITSDRPVLEEVFRQEVFRQEVFRQSGNAPI
jgi:tetratricopeptide (TPR) repeat protein